MHCNLCNRGGLGLNDFYSCSKSTCKECHKEKIKQYRTTKKGKAVTRAANLRWAKRNRIKMNAARAVYQALQSGILTKPSGCELCDSTDRIQGHHDDYRKVLKVRWLCHSCHADWHSSHGEAKNGR